MPRCLHHQERFAHPALNALVEKRDQLRSDRSKAKAKPEPQPEPEPEPEPEEPDNDESFDEQAMLDDILAEGASALADMKALLQVRERDTAFARPCAAILPNTDAFACAAAETGSDIG